MEDYHKTPEAVVSVNRGNVTDPSGTKPGPRRILVPTTFLFVQIHSAHVPWALGTTRLPVEATGVRRAGQGPSLLTVLSWGQRCPGVRSPICHCGLRAPCLLAGLLAPGSCRPLPHSSVSFP